MYKPDKATTERNAKILRELVKQPDNKFCADCKRNDPRWASWNLGVYLCIRCSGVHRGMGTHISRVKSIDLDAWTPEQMESIQKWGNRRANLYWETHLKAGHIPPDHKMESYIRSKYETRRWAMDGPPPSDPSVLDGPARSTSNGDTATAPIANAALLDTTPVPTLPHSRPTHAPTASLSVARPSSPSVQFPSTFRQNTANSHTQSRQLLSAAVAGRVQVSPPPSQTKPQPSQQQQQPPQQQLQPKPQDGLFSLDFHAPSVSKPTPQLPIKDVKQDILSLFSASTAHSDIQPSNAFGQFSSAPLSSASWGAPGGGSLTQMHGHGPPPNQPQSISMMGTTGTGFWGVSSGWTGGRPANAPLSATTAHMWGAPASATAGTSANALNNVMNTTDIWGGHSGGPFAAQTAPVAKKDDVFGDLWGDVK